MTRRDTKYDFTYQASIKPMDERINMLSSLNSKEYMLFLKITNSCDDTIDAKYYSYNTKNIVNHHWSFIICGIINSTIKQCSLVGFDQTLS